MAVAEVKRIELHVLRSSLEPVMAALQSWGRCDVSEKAASDVPETLAESASDYESALADLRYAIRFLTPRYDDPTSSIARMLGDRDRLTMDQLMRLKDSTDVPALVGQVREKERRLLELKSAKEQTRQVIDVLRNLSDLPCPLSLLTQGTKRVAAFLGQASPEALMVWKDALAEALGSDADVTVHLPADKKVGTPWGLAIYLREREEEFTAVALRCGVARLELPGNLAGSVSEEIGGLLAQLDEMTAQERAVESELTQVAVEHMTVLRQLADCYQILEDRREAVARGEKTAQTVALAGWVRSADEAELKRVLAPWEREIDLQVHAPQDGDNPPVTLENPKFAQPLEMLTMLYGAPVYGGADPSVPMFPFFLLFFGLCYGDAGYGVVVAAITWYVLHKYRSMSEGPYRFIKLIFYSGIATIIVGALTGGWFGNMVDEFPFLSFLRPVVHGMAVINPMEQPMVMLGLSLALGLVHIFYGLAIAFYTNVRHGKVFAAVADQGGWALLLIGLLTLGASTQVPSLAPAGKLLALGGAALLILTQGREKPTLFGKLTSGVLSLYGVTSYLGDVLSYSRLLALGLVGSAVAMIINLMSSMVAGVPYVGWVLALLLFFGGQIFSMVINILGAFVHPLRLQYVEFFGKFYESGGTQFEPLTYRTEYVTVAENDGRA